MLKSRILLVFLILIIEIECKPKLIKKPTSKISKETKRELHPENHFTKEQNEKYDEIMRKSLFLENRMNGEKKIDGKVKEKPFENKKVSEKEKKENIEKIRRLNSFTTLNDVGFFSLSQDTSSNKILAHKFLMENAKKDDSKFILYPYKFDYKDENAATKTQNEGGVFTLDQKSLAEGKFSKILNMTSVEIGKAKGIYDVDIAILSLTRTVGGQDAEVFSEASKYCSYLVSGLKKISTCISGKNEYLKLKLAKPTKGAVVLVNNTDILNNTLYDENGELLFKLLIIPEYTLKTEEMINEYFTEDGINIIKEFREKGGHLLVSGNSGFLLEKWGILPSGTYDTTKLLRTKETYATLNGCIDTNGATPDTQPDYFKQLICMNYIDKTTLSQTYPMNNVPSNFETLIEITNTNQKLYETEISEGTDTSIADSTKKFPYIISSLESTGKGRILIVNGNPTENQEYINPIRNFILYTMTRNVILNIKVSFGDQGEDVPIPGGEEGYKLNVEFKFLNVFTKTIENLVIDILTPPHIQLVENNLDSSCQIIKNEPNKYKDYEEIPMIVDQFLRCQISTVAQFSNYAQNFQIEILTQEATQKVNDIPLIYPFLSYKDTDINKELSYTPGAYLVQAALAALLRGTYNPDPQGKDPLEGKGNWFDDVLNVENKENTEARNVSFITIIPLIAPIFQDAQDRITQFVPIYDQYYKYHNYNYPWKNPYNKDQDFVDFAEVGGKNVKYVQDWSTPVKISKVSREDLRTNIEPFEFQNLYEPNGNEKIDESSGTLYSTSGSMLLKEIYYGDAEKFYESAHARFSLFIDDTTEEGAKALYGDTVPEDVVDPNNIKTARIIYGFERVDIFFWNSTEYCYPEGTNYTLFFSVDKFDQSSNSPDNTPFGFKQAKVINQGHYDSTKPLRNTLKPHEYSNVLRDYSHMKMYNPTDNTDMAKIKEMTNDTVKLTHYLVPVTKGNSPKIITKADSVMNFTKTNDLGEGYMTPYPSLKFIYAHSIKVDLDPEKARMGGIVKIYLKDNTFESSSISINEKVTIKADNVAFYKTEYESSSKVIILYYKRGLMPDEGYGSVSNCVVYIEGLSQKSNTKVKMEHYNVKYDFSSPTLESSEKIEEFDSIDATFQPFWSFPALLLEAKFKRANSTNPSKEGTIYEYELLNPYTRIGTYHQELIHHTTVWYESYSSHVVEPGVTAVYGGLMVLSAIGTATVPFKDYVAHGGITIPGAESTSRLEWTDVWGRRWVQCLRSLFPDVTPAPGPVLSFVMSTTFELLTQKNEERVLEWQTDENLYIRVHMKFVNNYPKFFIPLMCKDDQLPYENEASCDERNPIFITQPSDYDNYKIQCGNDHWVSLGTNSVYGVCYNTSGSYLSGRQITQNIMSDMSYMMSCAESNNRTQMSLCSNYSDEHNLPKLKKRTSENAEDNSPDKTWNYSPKVASYHPNGYIDSSMWDLTHEYYEDNAMLKGFPFHYDNGIPSLETGPLQFPSTTKPHSLVAFPIFKGFGYNMSYSNQYSLNKFKDYKGWWSDQLQNKDHTLLAGQEKVNEISVDKESLLKDSDWIHSSKLINTKKPNLVSERLKNIYVCKYNQHKIRTYPGQTRYVQANTVYQNYIVPVDPDLTADAPEYTNYNCVGENSYQYSPKNISQAKNRIYTGNDRDWLYFAVALRGEALENLNVIMKIEPLKNTKYEGITKVQDGARYTYWNPALGPNNYGIVDDVVNTVIGKRTDLEITQAIYPMDMNTFKQYAYHLFSISDPAEEKREYTMTTYSNTYGFGDSAVLTFVGGTKDTKCIVNEGDITYVKIVFYNNAGFNWNLKGDAIAFNDTGLSKPINAAQLLAGQVTNIQFPTSYNFMKLTIPDEIKNYITIEPSDHNIDVSPQFFDFQSINVVTIRDGFEGSYFYKITVKEDIIPENLRGKFWDIKVDLIEDYFDRLPFHNDPTVGLHDYHLKIPNIKIGFPYSKGVNKGKVFYILGQAKNILFTYKTYKYFNIEGKKIISEEDILKLDTALTQIQTQNDELKNAWDSFNGDGKENLIEISEKDDGNNYYKTITVNLTKKYPELPYEENNGILPYKNKIYLLIKTYASQVDSGTKSLLKDSKVYYNDFRKDKNQLVGEPTYLQCTTSGPWISVDIENTMVVFNKTSQKYEAVLENGQEVTLGDKKIIRTKVTLKNTGTGKSYRNNFVLELNKDATLLNKEGTLDDLTSFIINEKEDYNEMVVTYGKEISVNLYKALNLYFEVSFDSSSPFIQLRNLETTKPIKLVRNVKATLCITDADCNPSTDLNGGEEIIPINTEFKYKIISKNVIIEENEEKTNSKNGFPTWAIILIVLILFTVITILAWFLYKKFISAKKDNINTISENKEIMKTKTKIAHSCIKNIDDASNIKIYHSKRKEGGTRINIQQNTNPEV